MHHPRVPTESSSEARCGSGTQVALFPLFPVVERSTLEHGLFHTPLLTLIDGKRKADVIVAAGDVEIVIRFPRSAGCNNECASHMSVS